MNVKSYTRRVAAPPRWRRRADARPREILDAALDVFAENGYAAARLSDIAARARVSKTALYLYFATKADLFRAVLLEQPAAARTERMPDAGFVAALEAILGQLVAAIAQPKLRRLARMVIAESGNFPELARAWHDAIVGPALAALTAAIGAGQARGEVRPGDARLIALTVIGPMLAGVIWREVIEPAGGAPVDFDELAATHLRTLTAGLLVDPG